MMDWRLILLFVLLASIIGCIWFMTIRDIVKGISNLKSQEITNWADYDNCDSKP